MKFARTGLIVLLCWVTLPAYAYQLRAVQGAPVNDESAGQEFIEVVLEREPGDVGACQVDGVVEAIDNPMPGPSDALDGQDYLSQSFPFSLTIPAGGGQVFLRFAVPVLDDGLVEGTETFTANIAGFSAADPVSRSAMSALARPESSRPRSRQSAFRRLREKSARISSSRVRRVLASTSTRSPRTRRSGTSRS